MRSRRSTGSIRPGCPSWRPATPGGGSSTLNRSPDDPEVPHGGRKDVFVSVDEEDGAYPDGALVVKRGSQGDDPAGLVSVMLKVVNGNPQHGDWIFREYVRPRPDAAYTVLAENEACWSCHDGAGDTDWVFTKADG
ncbi:MAG: cytochrome P460 family protein [Thermoleophilia bacterium]|nr:cytochrome P460 family protein [Thermoleophilia bacterium]